MRKRAGIILGLLVGSVLTLMYMLSMLSTYSFKLSKEEEVLVKEFTEKCPEALNINGHNYRIYYCGKEVLVVGSYEHAKKDLLKIYAD